MIKNSNTVNNQIFMDQILKKILHLKCLSIEDIQTHKHHKEINKTHKDKLKYSKMMIIHNKKFNSHINNKTQFNNKKIITNKIIQNVIIALWICTEWIKDNIYLDNVKFL
jgi:hypothetical protein